MQPESGEISPSGPAEIRKSLRGAHPVVSATLAGIKALPPRSDTWYWNRPGVCYSGKGVQVSVSKRQLSRALRIADAVIRALIARGYAVELKEARHYGCVAKKDRASIGFDLREETRKIPAEKPDAYPRFTYEHKGTLAFRLYSRDYSDPVEVKERGQIPLEGKIDQILTKFDDLVREEQAWFQRQQIEEQRSKRIRRRQARASYEAEAIERLRTIANSMMNLLRVSEDAGTLISLLEGQAAKRTSLRARVYRAHVVKWLAELKRVASDPSILFRSIPAKAWQDLGFTGVARRVERTKRN